MIRRVDSSVSSLLASLIGCSLVLSAFLMLTPLRRAEDYMHWFIAPVMLCGVIIGQDVVRWLRGELNVFDPIGVIGLYGFHFFFVAPLLHVHWGFFMDASPPPPDWRPWLGGMATLNLLGLVIYRFVRRRWDVDAAASDEVSWLYGMMSKPTSVARPSRSRT